MNLLSLFSGHASILYVSMELAFDSLTFLLTISRTFYVHFYRGVRSGMLRSRGNSNAGMRLPRRSLLDSLVQDGALYFAYVYISGV